MKPKPYVGVTGPVNVTETQNICRAFSEAGYSLNGNYLPMLGFLASEKTLRGQSTLNRRYPPINSLSSLLQATDGKVFTMIHYNTKETNSLANQVSQIFEGIYEEGLCKAIQLNIVWPNISQIKKIKRKYPDMKIVFQASQRAMDGRNPLQIGEGIKCYGDLLDYVLIDPSGGRGLPFNLESSVAVYSELKEKCPNLTIGFAGGLTGQNVVYTTKELARKIGAKDFCIDTEGGLRDKLSPAYGDDLLNLGKVNDYLQFASLVLK